MFYRTINRDQQHAFVADAVVAREIEMMVYDGNILNYEIMLEELPQDDWPTDIADLRGAQTEYVAANRPCDLERVSQYQFRDRLQVLLGTERAERNKAKLILETLIARLPSDRADVLIAEAVARKEAAETIVAAQK